MCIAPAPSAPCSSVCTTASCPREQATCRQAVPSATCTLLKRERLQPCSASRTSTPTDPDPYRRTLRPAHDPQTPAGLLHRRGRDAQHDRGLDQRHVRVSFQHLQCNVHRAVRLLPGLASGQRLKRPRLGPCLSPTRSSAVGSLCVGFRG